MNALLLSAGEGRRLNPLTLKTPKCLLPSVDNSPILEYWIDTLIENGIDKIFINTWWLSRQITEYICNLNKLTRNHIAVHHEYYLEPIGEVLFKLRNKLGDRFIVVNSDTYIKNEAVKKFFEAASPSRTVPIYLATEKKEDVGGKGVISFSDDTDGLITKFTEKPTNNQPGYVWAGVALMSRMVIDSYIPNQLVGMELAKDIFPDFENRMAGIDVEEAIDIGESLNGYYQACMKIAERRI